MNSPRSTISLVVGLPQGQRVQAQLKACNKRFGATASDALPLINGYTIELPEDKLDSYLDSLPPQATVMRNTPFREPQDSVAGQISLDEPTSSQQDIPPDLSQDDVRQDGNQPKPTHPLGWDEAQAQGFDGTGVTIAVIDSGLYPHPDFGDRLKAYKNFSWQGSAKPSDDYGHGTHVAGIIAGDGDRFDGVAPKANLVGARITSPAEAIKAIDWVISNKDTYGINVMNLSLGSDARLPSHADPFAQAAQRAIDAGIITVVAAGNECKGDSCAATITTPGILPDAITVGAYNDGHTPELDDDSMWSRSSRGPTAPDGQPKPDLVAPGVGIWSTSPPESDLHRSHPAWEAYHLDTGTSMAAPMVGGAIALMLQANPHLTQRAAKEILQKTAIPFVGVDPLTQGAGRLNVADALAEARHWHSPDPSDTKLA